MEFTGAVFSHVRRKKKYVTDYNTIINYYYYYVYVCVNNNKTRSFSSFRIGMTTAEYSVL